MARALEEIVRELDAGYAPDRQRINEQLTALPQQLAAEESGLQAKEQDYFTNTILGGARERGVAFGGIPEGERARYGATEYLPALARLRQSGNELKGNLSSALTGLDRDQREKAMGLRQTELDRDEQVRQAELNRQESARQAAQQFKLNNPQPQAPAAGMTYTKEKGYQFKNSAGQPITANEYAITSNVPIADVLYSMAQSGDAGAQKAYETLGAWKANGYTPTAKGLAKMFPGIF